MNDLYILAGIGALAHFMKRVVEFWGDKSHNWKKEILYSLTYLLLAEAIIYASIGLSFLGYEMNKIIALALGYMTDSVLRTVISIIKKKFTSLNKTAKT